MARTSVSVPGASLELIEYGSGEPVLFVQTALTADELRPLAEDHALAGYRRIVYHRRGYAGSSPVLGPGSIARDAADAAALLRRLEIASAHLVGLSYAGAVVLQLAADAPELTRTLTLIEPPPVHIRSSAQFRAANEQLLVTRRESGPAAALDGFLSMLIGPGWARASDERLPGSSEQMQRDAATFFDTDIPALLDWEFGPADVARIACPVLQVGGTDSGPWFAEVRELLRSWFPQAEEVVVDGADHLLAVTHAPQIARRIAVFLDRCSA